MALDVQDPADGFFRRVSQLPSRDGMVCSKFNESNA